MNVFECTCMSSMVCNLIHLKRTRTLSKKPNEVEQNALHPTITTGTSKTKLAAAIPVSPACFPVSRQNQNIFAKVYLIVFQLSIIAPESQTTVVVGRLEKG